MLTQVLAPDCKCKLKISSFQTLLYQLDCLVCAKDIMAIVLLLQMMTGWKKWGGWFDMLELRLGWRVAISIFHFLCLVNCSFITGT